MAIAHLVILELVSYGFLPWFLFVVVVVVGVCGFGLRGLLVSQVVVACWVAMLDVQWVLREGSTVDVPGRPDVDFVFYVGVFFRIVLVNAVLLPVGLLALWGRRRINKNGPV
ncbi:MAG: hypothetical protein AAF750_16660 [Planctomycetota bacterium]